MTRGEKQALVALGLVGAALAAVALVQGFMAEAINRRVNAAGYSGQPFKGAA